MTLIYDCHGNECSFERAVKVWQIKLGMQSCIHILNSLSFAWFTRSYEVSNSVVVGCNDIVLCSIVCPVCGYQVQKIELQKHSYSVVTMNACPTFSPEYRSLCMQFLFE